MIASDKAGEPTVMEGGTMLKKFLMAAGLVAAFTLSPQAAEAKVKIIIGNPGYCYDHYDRHNCGGNGYFQRQGFYDRSPNFPEWTSCKEAKWIVRERGFRDVRTASCGGRYHVFIAKKRGDVFEIRIYSRNGRIHSIREI